MAQNREFAVFAEQRLPLCYNFAQLGDPSLVSLTKERAMIRLCSGSCRAFGCVSTLLLLSLCTGRVDAQDAAVVAKAILDQAQLDRGIATVVGAEGDVAVELTRASKFLVHVRDGNGKRVDKLRATATEAGFGIDRLVVERGDTNTVPFADNFVDLVAVTDAGSNVSVKEILRGLRPDGVAVIGAGDLDAVADDASTAGAIDIKTNKTSAGEWLVFRKAPLEGIDEWTHWEHGPDNNPVSTGNVIKAPYMTQFLEHPMYIGMPSITTAAGGRTFLAIGHISHHQREWDSLYKLIARNGYNGQVLWQRELPEGYLVHRSAFIATKETFYMIDGDGCLFLDPQTGVEQERLTLPGVNGEWKWMVMKDGVLFVLTGKKERGTVLVKGDREFGGWSWADLSPGYYGKYPHGFGHTLAAYDLGAKKLLWKHKEGAVIDSRSLAIRDDKLFLMCPEKHLRALELETGDVLWTNTDKQVRDLIAEPGKGLTSTPGFKTQCLTVATPDALIIQGQTRMNVVAVSTAAGSVLWTKRKITNNPNAIYIDGNVILGVGPNGSHVVLDPVSGEEKANLGFNKTACTRLTASGDSFFCRGEGTLRFDRKSNKVLIDGGARPACNDGALPANGMLYIGPWQCDCNLSLIGSLAKCSAGDFDFTRTATEDENLVRVATDDERAAFEITAEDWPSFRSDNSRSSSTSVAVPGKVGPVWQFYPDTEQVLSAPVTAGGLTFFGSDDGAVRAIDSSNGDVRWSFATAGPIRAAPTLWEGRAYVGSGDGNVYCVEAATGKLLWKFRAAPVERHIMLYGKLSSTWPVHTGVTIHDGVAHFAAGIIDHDGTYVYALDAKTGEIKWQNNSSGHLSEELRKGVSAQGNMTVLGGQLLLAGGNQVSPAPFNINNGKLNAKPFQQGRPKANNGQFVGVYQDKMAIVGGRVLYSAPGNVATKGSFVGFTDKGGFTLNFGGVPPAWDNETMALVNFKFGKIACFDSERVLEQIDESQSQRRNDRRRRFNLTQALREAGATRWETDLGEGNKFEAVSLVVCPNAIVSVVKQQQKFRSQPQWFVTALNTKNGQPLWRHELRGDPLPGGLLVDRDGQVIVTMLDGRVLCLRGQG